MKASCKYIHNMYHYLSHLRGHGRRNPFVVSHLQLQPCCHPWGSRGPPPLSKGHAQSSSGIESQLVKPPWRGSKHPRTRNLLPHEWDVTQKRMESQMLRRYASGSRRGRFGGSPSEHVSDRRTDAVCVRVRVALLNHTGRDESHM